MCSTKITQQKKESNIMENPVEDVAEVIRGVEENDIPINEVHEFGNPLQMNE